MWALTGGGHAHLCHCDPVARVCKPLANGVRHPLEAPRRAIAAKLEQVARRVVEHHQLLVAQRSCEPRHVRRERHRLGKEGCGASTR